VQSRKSNVPRSAPFKLLDRLVDPETNQIDGVRLNDKAMAVLLCLVDAAPRIVTHDTLLDAVWPNVIVTDNAVHQAVTHLRRALGDNTRAPRFIENIPRRGYRLLVEVIHDALIQPAPQQQGLRDTRDAVVSGTRLLLPQFSDSVLAVLPFENLSGDAELLYFSDGVSEEIMQTVARTTPIRVVGRLSSFQFRGDQKSVHKVVHELGVSHILDGSVRRSGQRIRITAQLIECVSQTTLWSDRFERQLSDVFAVQDEIAFSVARALRLAFAPSTRRVPIDPMAFDLYLRARSGPTTYVGAHDARLLEAAVTCDPNLAPAWAALALARAIEALDAGMSTDPVPAWRIAELRAEAALAAERALSLDTELPLAHAALAALQPVCGSFATAEAHLRRALTSGPDDPSVLLRMTRWCGSVGRLSDARSYVTRAYELDPLNPSVANDYASMLSGSGRIEEADAIFDANRARWPDIGYVAMNALSIATRRADWQRVDRQVADIRARGPWTPYVDRYLRKLDDLRNRPAALAEQLIQQLRRALAATGSVPLSVAAEACSLGRTADAYETVTRASFADLFEPGGRLLPGDFGLQWLFYIGRARMQRDRRFVALCARLGLCDYWLETDKWPDCAESLVEYYDFVAEARRALDVHHRH